MKFIISKSVTLSLAVMFGCSTLIHAETTPPLPTSQQVSEEPKESTVIHEVEIVPEIKIQTSEETTPQNTKLKEGIACDDENLEPAELGPDFVELPMAKTEPCSTVNCENLDKAILTKDNYKKIPMAKTIQGCQKK